MLAFILRRMLQAVMVMVTVAFIAFLLGQDARPDQIRELRSDCIKFARARGLSNRAIHFGHALIFVATHLVVDLLYFAVDPRLRVAPAGGH